MKRWLSLTLLVLALTTSAQASYTQQAALAVDATFQGQVMVAMLQAAANVMSEPITVAGHVQRAQFAAAVLRDPTKYQANVAWLLASQSNNPMTPLTVPSTVADSLVQTAVNAQWANLAGYFAQ